LPFLAINIISTFIGINSKNIPNIDLSKYWDQRNEIVIFLG
jgi:hypothetical protein